MDEVILFLLFILSHLLELQPFLIDGILQIPEIFIHHVEVVLNVFAEIRQLFVFNRDILNVRLFSSQFFLFLGDLLLQIVDFVLQVVFHFYHRLQHLELILQPLLLQTQLLKLLVVSHQGLFTSGNLIHPLINSAVQLKSILGYIFTSDSLVGELVSQGLITSDEFHDLVFPRVKLAFDVFIGLFYVVEIVLEYIIDLSFLTNHLLAVVEFFVTLFNTPPIFLDLILVTLTFLSNTLNFVLFIVQISFQLRILPVQIVKQSLVLLVLLVNLFQVLLVFPTSGHMIPHTLLFLPQLQHAFLQFLINVVSFSSQGIQLLAVLSDVLV